MSTLAEILDPLTVEGTLYERLPDKAVRCFACGHRCLIREGRRGICQARFNRGGELRVPWGYVAALQSDPIEKKPFFHVLPGSNALTFGMLGCDFHCGYCFTGDTMVVTSRGPRTLEQCFQDSQRVEERPDAQIGRQDNLYVPTRSGRQRRVEAIFKHPYAGDMVVIRPYYLPALRCTPDHRVFATADPAREPELVRAGDLTPEHYLAIPRGYAFSRPKTINVAAVLANSRIQYRTPWKISADEVGQIMAETAGGSSSRQIGWKFGKHPSYIRHIRSKYRRGDIRAYREGTLQLEGDTVRFPKEHKPGIPASIALDPGAARLLGLYCAEGSVVKDKGRPNSLVVNFSFAPWENAYAEETRELLKKCFGIDASIIRRVTTLGVSAAKASAGLLFKSLAGGKATEKRVPVQIFDAPRDVVSAFLDAVIDGDGHRCANGKISLTTVSHEFAYGIAWLALKCGHLPSIYDARMPEEGQVLGRKVKRSPHQYTVVWYEGAGVERRVVETESYYLVPLRGLAREEFEGSVYNMQVEEEHNYLAGFFLVSNCQNWMTSQAMRDPASDMSIAGVRKVTPDTMVELAHRTHASAMVSSYNEPLITSEWAVGIFKKARAAGLLCAYVSNGNNTPEVMEYIRPYISAYKVDLKCMQEKSYHKLGGVLKNTLDGIQRAHDLGLWVEIVTLVIPGFNDSNEELWDAARFIAGVSKDIPWHVTAFHKDYKMMEPDNTGVQTLLRAAEIGREAGLRYVYAGNLPGRVEEYENTRCSSCNKLLIERSGYVILSYRVTSAGACPRCGAKLPGLWPQDPAQVRLHGYGLPMPVW